MHLFNIFSSCLTFYLIFHILLAYYYFLWSAQFFVCIVSFFLVFWKLQILDKMHFENLLLKYIAPLL